MEQKEIRGYKVFNPDWTCRGVQYKVGAIFKENIVPKCCVQGFHFCLKAVDCFNYYSFNPNNKVAEIVALGEVDYEEWDSKCCTNKIKIVREVPWSEVLEIVNIGKGCTGIRNTGRFNTGDCNTGYYNTGHYNTGDYNTGYYNTGDYNTGDYNTGCFMTEQQKIMMFNKPSDWTHGDWRSSKACDLLSQMPQKRVIWVESDNMTDEEKAEHSTYKTTGGYLNAVNESEGRQLWWNNLKDEKKKLIISLPNFDADIFYECTGIRVSQDDIDEVNQR